VIIFAKYLAILDISTIQVFVLNAQVIAKNVWEYSPPVLNVIIQSFCIVVLV
jgi:hypothetical protein